MMSTRISTDLRRKIQKTSQNDKKRLFIHSSIHKSLFSSLPDLDTFGRYAGVRLNEKKKKVRRKSIILISLNSFCRTYRFEISERDLLSAVFQFRICKENRNSRMSCAACTACSSMSHKKQQYRKNDIINHKYCDTSKAMRKSAMDIK